MFRCFALKRTDTASGTGIRPLADPPAGYGPGDLQAAYGLPANGGAGQTVAIVDAYDNPNAEADLTVYRAQYGLPACTTANGCFKKVNQRGVQGSYPAPNTGWAGEIALDVGHGVRVRAAGPHHPGGGRLGQLRRPRQLGEHRRLAGREVRVQQLRHQLHQHPRQR